MRIVKILHFFVMACFGQGLYCDQTALETKNTKKRIRYSSAKGVFYPDNPRKLLERIQKALGQETKTWTIPANQSVVLIVPHAGYEHCEEVYAAAYAPFKNQKFDHVVLISGASQKLPGRHQASEKKGGISVFWTSASNFWETPLGYVPLDPITQKFAQEFNNPWTDHADIHKEESRIEIQLPWLQSVLDSFSIIPIMIDDLMTSEKLISFFHQIFQNKRVLYIISTNLGIHADQTLKDFTKMKSTEFVKYLRLQVDPFSAPEAVYIGLRLKELLHLPAFHVLKEGGKAQSYAALITAKPPLH